MFKVGDRVEIGGGDLDNNPEFYGRCGVVKWADAGDYTVEFDENINFGHTCGGRTLPYRGLYMTAAQIRPLYEDEISKAATAYIRKELSC